MAFTYDIATNRGKVRLAIGDTTSGAGPRPDAANFTDAEVDMYLDPVIAAGSAWRAAVPMLLRQLATDWARKANISIGEYSAQYSAVSAQYAEMAREWERQASTAGASVAGLSAGLMTLSGNTYTVQTDGSVI